jgi:hypothetical protein
MNGWRVSELVHEDKGKTTATEPKDEKDPKRARVVLSKGHVVVGLGYSTQGWQVLLQRSQTGEKIQVTPAGLTGLERWSSTTRVELAELAGLAKTTARIDKQIKLVGLAKTAAWIDEQIVLAGLATQSKKQEVPVGLLTWKARLWRIRLTRKAGLLKIRR